MYPNYGTTGLFADSAGCVAPFVCWIEDYPLPDGLKMNSHVGFYYGKEDPDNYLHLLKGFIHMQKWEMPVACHMFTYTLKDSDWIRWNRQKAGSIVNYKDLKAKFRSHFSQQKKFTKTHLAVHNIKQRDGETKEVATNGAPSDHKEGFDRFGKGFFWDNNRGKKKNRDRFSSYKGSNHGLLTNLSNSPREILATEKELRHQIKEVLKLGKLAHLVNGIKKGHAKTSGTQLGSPASKRKYVEELINGTGEITFPPVLGSENSSNPVIIKVRVSGRQVNRVYMDSGNSCEVNYEHCFLKLKPSIRSLRVDSKIPLIGFYGEHSWPLREVPLQVTVGESPYTRTETLNFVIVRSNSPYNLLLRRTAMQKMGIVVSTIHATIKFHTPCGIDTVFSTYEPNKVEEGQKKAKETVPKVSKNVLRCVDTEKGIIVNEKHPEQTVVIRKQLPTSFKRKLQDLMRSNVDVFA
ncbi:hypothetical protein Tco_0060019 [Tanacetum coccineum]